MVRVVSIGSKLSKSVFRVIAMCVLVSCGGGGGTNGGGSGAATVTELTITVDGLNSSVYENLDEAILVDGLVVATSDIAFELVMSGLTQCELADQPMEREGNVHTVAIKPAYFDEILDLQCSGKSQGTVVFKSDDKFVKDNLADYIETNIPVGVAGTDPYGGYRRKNYYGQIHRLISAAELYANSDIYGINQSALQKLENYLINTAEAFFEPCPDYDFYADESAQCRSLNRIGKYYQWRSPNTEAFRVNHAKAEWRAAGGVAQAVKAILMAYPPGSHSINCPISDEPSEMISTSLTCRALNLRRLLYQEIWLKWNDQYWVASIGLDKTYTLQDADIAHYVAWSEYIVDLFDMTSFEKPYTSRRDWLIEHFYDYGPYTGFSSNHPDDASRYTTWNGYPFGITGSVDLGHTDTTMHLLTMYGESSACSATQCAYFDRVAKAMSEQAWMSVAPEGGVGFPKFDVFMNGYCLSAYADPRDQLYEFCREYWLTEEGGWNSHRKLLGFVTLGKFDRNLMIKIRQSANSGPKNELYRYIVFLYKTLKGES